MTYKTETRNELRPEQLIESHCFLALEPKNGEVEVRYGHWVASGAKTKEARRGEVAVCAELPQFLYSFPNGRDIS